MAWIVLVLFTLYGGAMNRRLEDLEFHVEVWDDADLHVEELLAAAKNVLVARGAYEAGLVQRPGRILRLRHRARVIAAFFPSSGEGAQKQAEPPAGGKFFHP